MPHPEVVAARWAVGRGLANRMPITDKQPYASNPSFQPPAPVSDKLQTAIYRDLRTRTTGQISEQYNVSKARIEAIRKLKLVEEEFKRQVSIVYLFPLLPSRARMTHNLDIL